MTQEQQGDAAGKKASVQEKASAGVFALMAGAAGLYFLLGWAGSLVTESNYVRLNPPIAIEGKVVRYEERHPMRGFWRYFPFIDKDGVGVTTVTEPGGSLVARLTDNDSNGEIGNGDVVEVFESIDGISGAVTYHNDKAVDSDGKTEFKEPSTVLQAKVLKAGKLERAKWDSWLQQNSPAIKAKLQEQYQQQGK